MTKLEKEHARSKVSRELASGRLCRPETCETCGRVPAGRRALHGHHPDYNKPLIVSWLCSKCHGAAHRSQGPDSKPMGCPEPPFDYRWQIVLVNDDGETVGGYLFPTREIAEACAPFAKEQDPSARLLERQEDGMWAEVEAFSPEELTKG